MKVFVKTLKGNHFDIEVQPTDTVLYVKQQIQQIQGAQTYPSEKQLLIYQGRMLTDETTIEENKVSENTFLVVMAPKTPRQDDNLTVPVQKPSTIESSSSDLKGKGLCQNVDKGECSSAEYPTGLRVKRSQKKARQFA